MGSEEALGVGRTTKPANEHLRALITESGVSHKGLARRVVELGTARGVRGLAYDHSSVARWLAGERPREPTPELIAEVLAGLLHRRLSMADVGMAPSAVAADMGRTLAANWTECVTAATTLSRADLERRRFLLDSAVAASASSAAALQWLVSPAPTPLSGTGRRHVGSPTSTRSSRSSGPVGSDNRLERPGTRCGCALPELHDATARGPLQHQDRRPARRGGR
jgi:hypothetical protein